MEGCSSVFPKRHGQSEDIQDHCSASLLEQRRVLRTLPPLPWCISWGNDLPGGVSRETLRRDSLQLRDRR